MLREGGYRPASTLVVFSSRAELVPESVGQTTYKNGQWGVPVRVEYRSSIAFEAVLPE
jgi:hypothetical protein